MGWPRYVGPAAYGVKMGLIVPGCDLQAMIVDALRRCAADGLLGDRDVVCVTESAVARAQENYVTVDAVAREVRDTLTIPPHGTVGVVFPIASRNRFSSLLRGIARAVPSGSVVVVMSVPCDEVGNEIVEPQVLASLGWDGRGALRAPDLPGPQLHPVTGVDYLALYREIIASEGAEPRVILSNDPLAVLSERPDGIIAADIHTRERTRMVLAGSGVRTVTLRDLCAAPAEGRGWSEWGLLGSNLSAEERIKLAPREAPAFASDLQARVLEEVGLPVEVLVYGDGAYKDPSTGIYELADPQTWFGATAGLSGRLRGGIKYKRLADALFLGGGTVEQFERALAQARLQSKSRDDTAAEGTTPRRVEDIIASLADLVSGSSDAGTPLVVVRGLLP